MDHSELIRRRLANQRLSTGPWATAAQVVGWLGAVQAQDFGGAKWAVAQRTAGLTEADLDAAVDTGTILRTHVLRPTWHFVTPADIRWLLDLSRERVLAAMAPQQRTLGLEAALLHRCGEALTEALHGGGQLTRAELLPVLAAAGLTDGTAERGPYVLGWAELQGRLCSGARRGKQQTYALLDERAPRAAPLEREAALAALARRYVASRGPATAEDLAWWGGLTLTQAKAALALVAGELESALVGEATYWFAPGARLEADSDRAYLLPNYDEYMVGYADRAAMFDAAHGEHLDARGNVLFENSLLLGGRVAGTWKRTIRKQAVEVALRPFETLTAAQTQAVKQAAARYGAYAGKRVELI